MIAVKPKATHARSFIKASALRSVATPYPAGLAACSNGVWRDQAFSLRVPRDSHYHAAGDPL